MHIRVVNTIRRQIERFIAIIRELSTIKFNYKTQRLFNIVYLKNFS